MRIPAAIYLILVTLTIALPGNSPASADDTVSFERANIKYTLFDVSIPNIPMRPGDRIERFDCEVLGTVERISVPHEWKITVDNPTGDRTMVRAQANVGAAAFDEDISYFHDFLRIAKMSVPGRQPHFSITVTLWISDMADNVRKEEFSESNLILSLVSVK